MSRSASESASIPATANILVGIIPRRMYILAVALGTGLAGAAGAVILPYSYVFPTIETAKEGTYPLSRDLYMYTAGEPVDVIAEYLTWIMSPEGQAIVENLGFIPLEIEQ